jgi:hypothetical protein
VTQTIARDTRTRPPMPPPMPPPKGVSVADNLPVAWVIRWNPDRGYGYFTLGPDLYRVALVSGDAHCSTWHVAKVVRETGEPAVPYCCCLPTPGSSFAASCDCRGFLYRRQCRHLPALTFALDNLEVHEITDDAVDRFELAERLAG